MFEREQICDANAVVKIKCQFVDTTYATDLYLRTKINSGF